MYYPIRVPTAHAPRDMTHEVTTGSVFDDLGFGPGEAEQMKIKAAMLRHLPGLILSPQEQTNWQRIESKFAMFKRQYLLTGIKQNTFLKCLACKFCQD